MTEKLTYEDAYVGELLVNKINELIDRLDALEDRIDDRFNAHWKYHRIKQEELDLIKRKVGIRDDDEVKKKREAKKEEKSNESKDLHTG